MGTRNPAKKATAKKAASGSSSSKSYKVGDVWDLPAGVTVVVLPDGAAVTARERYTLAVPGTHKAVSDDGAGRVVATVDASDK